MRSMEAATEVKDADGASCTAHRITKPPNVKCIVTDNELQQRLQTLRLYQMKQFGYSKEVLEFGDC